MSKLDIASTRRTAREQKMILELNHMIDAAIEDVAAGRVYTYEESRVLLASKRAGYRTDSKS